MPAVESAEALCAELLRAKEIESAATDARIAVERQIIELFGLPDEGSKTVDAEGYKIRLEQKINRKLDDKKWQSIMDKIPEHLRPVIVVDSFKIDDKGVRYLRDNEPGYYKILAQAIEEKPAKPSVKVEVVS